MTNKTLSINFFAEKISTESKVEFMTAIAHESYNMSIQLVSDSIANLDKKLENKNNTYSAEELTAFQVQKDAALEQKKKLEGKAADTLEVYTKVVNAMSLKNADGFGNSKDVVRTVLRVLASWDNSKLVKYAIIPAFESPELYEALEAIHVKSKAGEDGNISMSKEVREAYKKASNELERIIKVTFSLPFETEYTGKTRVKLTAEDKKLLNDCYVRGFKNNFNVDDETGAVTFKKRTVNTLVKAKKNKKTGETTYDYSALASTISNIVIKHYFA